MRVRLSVLAVALLGLAACEEAPADKRAGSPYYRPPTPAEAACDRQGFLRGTNDYDACIARETGQDRPLPPVVAPEPGVQVFRDEFGNRYDALGNRLDAQGRIIAPPVTKP
jgi:hypothetical protein